MTQASSVLFTSLIAIIGMGCAGHVVYASGLYQGTVVDAATGQPLLGTVVLAIWYREVPVAPHGPAVDYHDSLEVLTNARGEFLVPARTHVTPIGKIREPEIVAYSPGYAPFPSPRARPQGPVLATAYERRLFRIELTRLATRTEKVREADLPLGTGKVPAAKMPNLIRLVNEARRALSLQPIHDGSTPR